MVERLRLPWLALLVGLLFLVYPAVRLTPLVDCTVDRPATAGTGDSNMIEVGRTAHFRLLAPNHYMSPAEVDRFLDSAERHRRQLVAFMSPVDAERVIDIRLYPQMGVAHLCGPSLIELYGLRQGHNDLVHELTHALMACNRSFLSEGLAVAMEDRFGWGVSALTRCRPVEAYLYAYWRTARPLERLTILWDRPGLRHPSVPGQTSLGYLEAGSFVNFLIDRYGWDAFRILYESSSFHLAYGRALSELEAEWRGTLRKRHVLQALTLTAGGVAVLALAGAAGRDPLWSLPGAVGLAAFDLWASYLVYPFLLAGLMGAAVIAVVCLSRLRAGRWWWLALLVGAGILVWLILVPSLFPPAGSQAFRA